MQIDLSFGNGYDEHVSQSTETSGKHLCARL